VYYSLRSIIYELLLFNIKVKVKMVKRIIVTHHILRQEAVTDIVRIK